MDPAHYFRNAWPEHFKGFADSLDRQGSCSRMRAHQKQDFWGEKLSSSLGGAFQNRGIYFSVGDLIAAPSEGFPDHLRHIPHEMQINFLCALSYVVLIDQVIYTHFKPEYAAFQVLTQYPKMDRSVGWARTMMMANPYEALAPDVLAPRSISPTEALEIFAQWAPFIVSELAHLFSNHQIGVATWSNVRQAMLLDSDCISGKLGDLLRLKLLSAAPSVDM